MEELIGTVSSETPSRNLKIVWVWGYDRHHEPGNHDYTRVRDLMEGLLSKVPRVTVETAYEFPSREQFAEADLFVFYLHLPDLEESHLRQVDACLARGAGIVVIHETMIQRPRGRGEAWSERIGLAWAEGQSHWGPLYVDVKIDNKHPIFGGLPSKLRVVDEFYWDLVGDPKKFTVLGTSPAGPGDDDTDGPAKPEELDGGTWPVFWTMEKGKGRVFASLPGHNTFLFHDPLFRIILFRGIAWAAREKPGPFVPLAYEGITKDGMVGTTQTYRDWQQKPRKPGDEEER